VDLLLSKMSWDRTWSEMSSLIDGVVARREPISGLPVPGTTDVARPRPASTLYNG
jgi:hypothetical protein